MSGRHLVGSCGIVAFAVACGSDSIAEPPRGLAHAVATSACGPTDGPAVWIYLTGAPVQFLEPPPPYVRIAVWQPLERLPTGSWELNAGDTSAAAWYFSSANDFEVGTTGRVTVEVVGADSTIRGSADLRFPRFGHVRGGFRAAWVPRATLCG